MLDLATLRSSPEAIRHSMARRGLQVPVEDLANTEARIRQLRHEADNMRAAQRSLGKEIAGLRGEEKRQAIESAASLASRVKELNARAGDLSERFYREWHTLPNLVAPSAADGLT